MFPGRWFKIKSTETPDLIKCIEWHDTQGRCKIIRLYSFDVRLISIEIVWNFLTELFI